MYLLKIMQKRLFFLFLFSLQAYRMWWMFQFHLFLQHSFSLRQFYLLSFASFWQRFIESTRTSMSLCCLLIELWILNDQFLSRGFHDRRKVTLIKIDWTQKIKFLKNVVWKVRKFAMTCKKLKKIQIFTAFR